MIHQATERWPGDWKTLVSKMRQRWHRTPSGTLASNLQCCLADRVAVRDLPAPVLQSARSTISCQGKRPDQDQTLELIRPALRLRCTRSDVLAQACSARFASWTRPGLSSRPMVLRCLHGNRAISLTVCLAFKWMRNWYFFRMWRLKKSYRIFFVIWLEKIPLHL